MLFSYNQFPVNKLISKEEWKQWLKLCHVCPTSSDDKSAKYINLIAINSTSLFEKEK